jgi:predicted nucleotidyltransferase
MSLTEAKRHPLADRMPEGLLESIVRHLNPQRVILFGSQVRGTTHVDSDWDLLLILDDDVEPEQVNWRVTGKIRREISGAAVDLIPFRESTFRERVDIVGSLPWIAATEGVIVYDRDKAA